MYQKIYFLIIRLLARRFFYRLNKRLYLFSLNLIGILNYHDESISGEVHFIRQLSKLYPQDFVVFDVGAHIGNYSKLILNYQSKAKVYAFEPHPLSFSQLVQLAEKLKFNTYNFACSDKKGEAALYDYKLNDGSPHASLFEQVFSVIHKYESVPHSVSTIKLDDFIAEYSIKKINLIKIDVEGNEVNVLHGLKSALANNLIDIIQIEFNEMNVLSKLSFWDLWNLLPNFRFYRLLPHSIIALETYQPIFLEIYAFQNIIAVNHSSSIGKSFEHHFKL